MKSVIFILVVVILVSCKSNNQSQNIVKSSIINGSVVEENNELAKSVVGIVYNDFSVWSAGCTGTVLNDRIILTAAHCVQDNDPKNLLINFSLKSINDSILSFADLEKQFVVRKVKSFLIHPSYDGLNDDFAVILLEDEAPFDSIPVKFLPVEYLNIEENKTTLDGQMFTVKLMGFGATEEVEMYMSDVLRETKVSGKFVNQLLVTDQTKGSGGCHGDSGGPAFIELNGVVYQVGVTHGPHEGSNTCHEEGQWINPALDKAFITEAQASLLLID